MNGLLYVHDMKSRVEDVNQFEYQSYTSDLNFTDSWFFDTFTFGQLLVRLLNVTKNV